ncbi:MAG: hypothetical protein JO069_10070 [Verrucomicrobia bacterium]|nr:hypothetical protein [Verrucomicrobiota bacterium]
MPKKVPVSIRITPELKAASERAARLENRSFTNLVETLLRERCRKHGIKLSDSSHG